MISIRLGNSVITGNLVCICFPFEGGKSHCSYVRNKGKSAANENNNTRDASYTEDGIYGTELILMYTFSTLS